MYIESDKGLLLTLPSKPVFFRYIGKNFILDTVQQIKYYAGKK